MKTLSFFSPKLIDPPTLPYLLTIPDDRRPDEKLPMIVFLHGAGERGTDGHAVPVHGIPKYFSKNSSAPENAIWLIYLSTSSAVMPIPLSEIVNVPASLSSLISTRRSPNSPLNSPHDESVFHF